MLKISIYISIFFIISCSNNKPVSNNYFDIKLFFENEIQTLKANKFSLKKKLIFNETTDVYEEKNPDWKKELAPFLETDITKPSYNGRFIIENFNKEMRYTSTDIQTDIKSIKILYNEADQLSSIEIILQAKNNLYQSEKKMNYIKDSMFSIEGWQKVRLLEPTVYNIKGFIKKLD